MPQSTCGGRLCFDICSHNTTFDNQYASAVGIQASGSVHSGLVQLKLTYGTTKSGGMELLFDQQTSISVTLPSTDRGFSMRELLPWMRDNLLRERPELFMQGDSV
jgi:hypothetical protein